MSLFDASWYLVQNPDVAAAGMDPLFHYETYGWREGRDPGPAFDTSDYLERNPDVAAAGVDPLEHYMLYGQYEGRVIDPAGTDLHAVSPPPILVSPPTPPPVAGRFVGTTGDDSIEGNGVIRGLAGNDTLTGGSGHDTLVGGLGNDMLYGSDGNDLLAGGNGNDYLSGGDGDNNIHGGNGDDALNAGNGDDLLYAGAGNDELNGGDGANLLYGGTGADAFHSEFSDQYQDNDTTTPGDEWFVTEQFGDNTIADFQHGDRISIEVSTGFTVYTPDPNDTSQGSGNEGGADFLFRFDDIDTNHNGRTDTGDNAVTESGGNTVINLTAAFASYDVDGPHDVHPEGSITILHQVGLTAADFES